MSTGNPAVQVERVEVEASTTRSCEPPDPTRLSGFRALAQTAVLTPHGDNHCMGETELPWLRSEEDEQTRVGIAYEPPTFDPYLAELRIRVETDRLRYDGTVLVSSNADGLAAFLAGLVEDWRGWSGTRRWDALEHGMSIHAAHHGRRVELLFVVRRDYKPDAWELRVPVLIAPGETLSQFARAAASTIPNKIPADI
jgi:Family of unknown function (DUF6228)